MDPTYPTIDSNQFSMYDYSEFYGEVEEPIPPNAPKAIDKVVDLNMFVNSDHAEDKHTQLKVDFLYISQYCSDQLVF